MIGWYRTENSFVLLVYPVLSTMHDVGLSMLEGITNHVMVGIYCAYSIPLSFINVFPFFATPNLDPFEVVSQSIEKQPSLSIASPFIVLF